MGTRTYVSSLDDFTDEQILTEVKRRKLVHPDIVDGWQKARKITALEESIKVATEELEKIKNGG